jgi:lysozyme
MNDAMRLSDRGVALIAFYEASVSLRLCDGTVPYPGGSDKVPLKYKTVYMDKLAQPNVLTVGLGITSYDEPGLMEDTVFNDHDLWVLFRKHIVRYEQTVIDAVKVTLNQNEFDALVSFVFNVGESAFRDSTLLRKLNSGARMQATNEFHRWTYAGGKYYNGLANRRASESILFAKPVKPLRENLASSRTVQAATVAGIVSATTALAPAMGPANEIATFIKDNTALALVALACISMYLVYVRWHDWRRGKR